MRQNSQPWIEIVTGDPHCRPRAMYEMWYWLTRGRRSVRVTRAAVLTGGRFDRWN